MDEAQTRSSPEAGIHFDRSPKAVFGAGPVYKLLGKTGFGVAQFPPGETALIDGEVAFRQRGEGYTTIPNWPTFLRFAVRYFESEADKR